MVKRLARRGKNVGRHFLGGALPIHVALARGQFEGRQDNRFGFRVSSSARKLRSEDFAKPTLSTCDKIAQMSSVN